MKTIGLLGGMSWESTQTYYSLLNREVKARSRWFAFSEGLVVESRFCGDRAPTICRRLVLSGRYFERRSEATRGRWRRLLCDLHEHYA